MHSTANDRQTGNHPKIGPQMIPLENEKWHGVTAIIYLFIYLLFYTYLFIYFSTSDDNLNKCKG